MPYASPEALAAAAHDLAGSHALSIVTVPALLHANRNGEAEVIMYEDRRVLDVVPGFGGREQKWSLEPFKLQEGRSPYLAVWASPPAFVRANYATSTLQRQRTMDPVGQRLFIIPTDERGRNVGTALAPDADRAARTLGLKPVNRVSLALWLGRGQDFRNVDDLLDWFDDATRVDERGLGGFYPRTRPAWLDDLEQRELLWQFFSADNDDILRAIGTVVEAAPRAVPLTVPQYEAPVAIDSDEEEAIEDGPIPTSPHDGLGWTEDVCTLPLRDVDVSRLAQVVLDDLASKDIQLPDAETLVRRCVVALLIGHLVLQGPPGTGKTTLARALADAFNVDLIHSTATSEWSPYQVVGGLRPGPDGGLQPSYGKVADAALQCARHVRAERDGTASVDEVQATWLLIDEFNRADIDKAIGSLYTMLSSVSASNLLESPIDLWFEEPDRQQLWVPARFRIIAAMNDLDTSFVNPLSQGLTRRFQFVTIGVPAEAGAMQEVQSSLRIAHRWLEDTYNNELTVPVLGELEAQLASAVVAVVTVVKKLRYPAVGAGWPVGTAQLVDLFKVTSLQTLTGADAHDALDWALADRLVPQMAQLDEAQLESAAAAFESESLTHARAAVNHLIDPLR